MNNSDEGQRERDQHEVTRLLERLGDSPDALSKLADLVYEDIHRLAHFQRYQMRAGETLRTTALVNEAFIKLFREEVDTTISDRKHLMRLMVRAIRQIIVDHARKQLAKKRGGDAVHLELNEERVSSTDRDAARVLDIEAAIERLAEMDADLAELISARFFAGYTTDELAGMTGVSRRTVQRQLKRASAWLKFELQPD